MGAKKKLLVYLDPGFLENRGHYSNFATNIRSECAARGIELRHYVNAHASADVCRSFGMHPIFARSAYITDFQPLDETEAVIRSIDQGIRRAMAEVAEMAGHYDEIVYYMYTGHPVYISSLALLLNRYDHGRTPVSACVVLFYLSDYFCYGQDDGRYAAYLRSVSDQLEALDPQGRVHVGIDSDTALDAYQKHFARTITAVPFPHIDRPSSRLFQSVADKAKRVPRRLRITYTGYPHSKYGFHLVLALLNHAAKDPLFRDVDFAVKTNARVKEDDLVERAKIAYRQLSGMELHDGYMDDAAYQDLLARTDLLLIPYNSQYNHDTSAVLVDGLLNGCVVVSAEPSWMAHIAEDYGSGVTYKPEDADSFVAAIRAAVADFPRLRAGITRRIRDVPPLFSAEGLFDCLFPRWRSVVAAPASTVAATSAPVVKKLLPPPPNVAVLRDGASASRLAATDMIAADSIAAAVADETALAALEKELRQKLPVKGGDQLPPASLPLAARVAQLRTIVATWGEREHYREQFCKLRALYKDRDRCIIVGADAVIDDDTLRLLAKEVVFAPNETYRMFRVTPFKPTFIVMEGRAFVERHAEPASGFLESIKMVPYPFSPCFTGRKSVIYFNHQPRKSYPHGYDFSTDAGELTYTSCTMILTSMQIAASLGFRKIVLLGVNIAESSPEYEQLRAAYGEAARVCGELEIELVNAMPGTRIPSVPFGVVEPFHTTQARARELVADAAAKDVGTLSPEELGALERELLSRHPCPSDIYLPTSKYEAARRIEGIRKVVGAWENRALYTQRLRALKARVEGRNRCFIIGNGPSLNKTNLDLLENEVTFATNGIFLKFPETRFRPTIYVVEDHLVGEDRNEEINALTGFAKLAPYYLAYCVGESPETIYYNHRGRISYPHGFDFSTNAEEITYTGCTVTFSCMQLAYYMGFKEIYLIGVDMSYAIPDSVQKRQDYDTEILDMDDDDPNHFVPNYFGRGYRWHDPNVDKMEQAYIEARRVTERHGVTIYNATVGGKCEVFERVDYYSLFPDGDARRIDNASPPLPVPATQAPATQREGAGQRAVTAGKTTDAGVAALRRIAHLTALDQAATPPSLLVIGGLNPDSVRALRGDGWTVLSVDPVGDDLGDAPVMVRDGSRPDAKPEPLADLLVRLHRDGTRIDVLVNGHGAGVLRSLPADTVRPRLVASRFDNAAAAAVGVARQSAALWSLGYETVAMPDSGTAAESMRVRRVDSRQGVSAARGVLIGAHQAEDARSLAIIALTDEQHDHAMALRRLSERLLRI